MSDILKHKQFKKKKQKERDFNWANFESTSRFFLVTATFSDEVEKEENKKNRVRLVSYIVFRLLFGFSL